MAMVINISISFVNYLREPYSSTLIHRTPVRNSERVTPVVILKARRKRQKAAFKRILFDTILVSIKPRIAYFSS